MNVNISSQFLLFTIHFKGEKPENFLASLQPIYNLQKWRSFYYDFIKDFVEIFNKPNHTYKNIEAKLLYRTTQAVKDLGITLQDIISLVLKEDKKFPLFINDNNRLKIDDSGYEMLKRLKGIQLNPESTYREF